MKSDLNRYMLAAAVLLAALALLPFVVSGYVLYVANMLLVYVVLALGMHIVMGESGQFAISHAAFFGIGIYVSGTVTRELDTSFLLSILAAGLFSGAVGLLLGFLALRMKDIYLALATFAFGEAMVWVFNNWTAVTGGSSGFRIPPANAFGMKLVSDAQAYPYVAALTLVMFAVCLVLVRSRLGRAMRAVRESEVAAQAMGIHVKRTKVLAFGASSFFAGVAGGMYTLFSSFIQPESLGFQTTIVVLTMVVVGGIGSISGAVCGAIVFGLVSELMRRALAFQEIIFGLILMTFMMYAPGGVFQLAWKALRNLRKRRPSTVKAGIAKPSSRGEVAP